MKLSDENKSRIGIGVIVCVMFIVIMTFINIFLENKFEMNDNTKAATEDYRCHVAMVNTDASDELWLSVYEGAKAQGEKQGIFIENFGERLVEEYSTEQLFEMAVAAKVDGIIVLPDNIDEMASQIKAATKAGIPVMTILSDVPNSGRVSFVSGNNYTIGEMYGKQIIEEVEKKWNEMKRKIRVTVLVDSGSEGAVPNLIYSGIHEATSSAGNKMELVTNVIQNMGNFESEETVRELLLGPEPPDVIVCLRSVDTISAYQSIIDYNRVGQTSIIGYYSSDDTLEGIRKGIIKSSIVINAEELGKVAADGMCEYLDKHYVSEYLTVMPTLITSENVEEYMSGEK